MWPKAAEFRLQKTTKNCSEPRNLLWLLWNSWLCSGFHQKFGSSRKLRAALRPLEGGSLSLDWEVVIHWNYSDWESLRCSNCWTVCWIWSCSKTSHLRMTHLKPGGTMVELRSKQFHVALDVAWRPFPGFVFLFFGEIPEKEQLIRFQSISFHDAFPKRVPVSTAIVHPKSICSTQLFQPGRGRFLWLPAHQPWAQSSGQRSGTSGPEPLFLNRKWLLRPWKNGQNGTDLLTS